MPRLKELLCKKKDRSEMESGMKDAFRLMGRAGNG
jgi:hypothetical protein